MSMSAAAIAKLALLFKEQSKKKGFWLTTGVIISLPIFLLVFIVVIITSAFSGVAAYFNDELEVYEKAVSAVAQKFEIENNISPYLVKTLHVGLSQYTLTYLAQTEIERFIKDNLVKETKTTILVPVEKEESSSSSANSESQPSSTSNNEEIEYEEKIIYEYRFYYESELFDMAKKPPFSIPIEDLQFICSLSFNPDISFAVTPGKFQNPIAGYITSMYGERSHPITGKPDFHTAVDIAAKWHDPVIAIADGVVFNVSRDGSYGNNITVKHDIDGQVFYAFYAHLSQVNVIPGQSVVASQTIGLEGGEPGKDPYPGTSTGHHLHFEIRLSTASSSHTNPLAYIKGY